ncbi:MAG TPA: helicase-exonuclease AddAB subunit AddA [Syntrophomonadaceae bacterium]|nr:helicase-exonuclease AddAB subunit AddA [Syntrophomonadaceae bacterium]
MRGWTEEQQKAIHVRDCNLLVSAGAGSGKTAVLVERIIQLLIQEKMDLDRFLVVTFTQAAAAEMRARIGTALLEQLGTKQSDENHLRHQLYLLNNASISTLHSFCSETLRRYFHIINLDPNFRVSDENESQMMKDEVLEDLLEEQYQLDTPEFTALVESFGGSKSDQAVGEIILRLHSFIHSLPQPWNWLRQQVECFDCDSQEFLSSSWIQSLLDQVKSNLFGISGLLKAACELALQDPQLSNYVKTLAEDQSLIGSLLIQLDGDGEAFFSALGAAEFARLSRAGKEADPFLKDHVQGLRKEAREHFKKTKAMAGQRSLDEWQRDLNRLHPLMNYLAHLVGEFHKGYTARKEEKNLLDFNDLEHQALRVLDHQVVAEELRQRFKFIFVDEYQDSNLVQESIIEAIRKEENLFLVGDIKQSIYRFRLSDPNLFLKKYGEYGTEAEASKLRIDLNANFRSHPAILDVVNSLFQRIMSTNLGEMDYGEDACLKSGKASWAAEQESERLPPVQMIVVEQETSSTSEEASEDEWDGMELEARVVAQYIRDQVGELFYDPNLPGLRPIQYRDIVVLMRATRRWATVFWEALAQAGVPAYADINTGYFEALEVQVFLNLLRLIDNKKQDLPLLSVMRSQLGGFTLEELVEIRLVRRNGPYYQALELYAHEHQDDLSRKVRGFQQQLEEWQEASNSLPVDELIWRIMLDTGYYYYVGAMPGGSQRQANLRLLLDRARQYQQSSLHGLFNFIHYLERIQKGNGDLGVAKSLGENENLVRIMSIHKSKGLEFPIVIVAGLGKKFNQRDAASNLLLHRQLGLGPRYVDLDLRIFHDTLARSVIRNKIRSENLSEEMRILYVALTRAESKLVLVGSLPNLERSVRKWLRPMDSFNLSNAGSYLDWIGPVLLRHPDGEMLRRYLPSSDLIEDYIEDGSHWQVQILSRQAAADLCNKIYTGIWESEEGIIPDGFDQIVGEIEGRLNWIYPYEYATRIPSKLSVSQVRKLKNRGTGAGIVAEIPPLVTRPAFLSGPVEPGRTYTAAEKGSIVHFVLQHLDLARVSCREDIVGQMAELVEQVRLSPEDAEQVNVTGVLHFFQSPLGCRVMKAPNVYRELPFNLIQDAGMLIPGENPGYEPLIVQGVIDLCFTEGEEMVLIDFKTDAVSDPASAVLLIDSYRPQLDLYQQALENIMGRRVKERYIYLFALEQAVPVD